MRIRQKKSTAVHTSVEFHPGHDLVLVDAWLVERQREFEQDQQDRESAEDDRGTAGCLSE